MAKYNEGVAIKEVLRSLFKDLGVEDKIDEQRIVAGWKDILGPFIANRTGKIYLKKDVLFVQVHSAALKNELMIAKSKVIEKLNDYLGKVIIKDLVVR